LGKKIKKIFILKANNKDNGQCVSLRIYDLQINDASQYKIVAM